MFMQRAKIVEGKPYDWDSGAEAMRNVVSADGQINYKAAMCADPGVTKCPKCETYYWAEGVKLQCLKCDEIFSTYGKTAK